MENAMKEDWTEKLIVKYVGQKISKVRWRPTPNGRLHEPSMFVTGAWDNQVNLLSLWVTPITDRNSSDCQPSHCEPELLFSQTHQGSVTDMKFMDESFIITASSCGHVTVYAIDDKGNNFKMQHHWNALHHGGGFSPCACSGISVDHSNIVTVGEDGKIFQLDTKYHAPVRIMDSTDRMTLNAVIHISSNEIASIGSTGELKLWDLRISNNTNKKVMFLSGDKVSLESVDRHPYQPYLLVTGDADGIIGVWDIRHELYPVTLIEAHESEVWELKFHPKYPDNVFTCSEDGSVWYWDATSVTSHANGGSQKLPVPYLGSNTIIQCDTQQLTSPWLYLDANKHKMETYSLLPFNRLPVNTFDIHSSTLICGTDGEAVILVQDLPIK